MLLTTTFPKSMGETLITTLTMESNHLSTLLSMDSSSSPPDINLPLSAEPSPPPPWTDSCDILDVNFGPHHFDVETNINVTKIGKKCAKRLDSVWGAWFFFNFYFKPVLNEKSKSKMMIRDNNGVSGCDKSDLKLDVFLVQHDMENMYMWVFKERPENALGKMQLRSYMNGHSRQGERPFPFCADKGFVRSHRMQRKQYRGLSNPQCVHGIEVVWSPNLKGIEEEEMKKWMELTGRELNFSIPLEASDFGSWRNLPNTEFELERQHNTPILKCNIPIPIPVPQPIRVLNGSNLSSMDLLSVCNKRRKTFFPHGNDDDFCLPNESPPDRVLDIHPIEPHWLNDFTGVMRGAYGPVVAAKSIYEDEKGFLIIVSLPLADLEKVKVTWRNTLSHGIIKISCVSIGCTPLIKRQDRTFRLTDPTPEHCPPGEFIREISLPTRIPEDAKLEAYGDETGTLLEVMVPKHRVAPEEHEVRVCLRPSRWSERPYIAADT